MSSCASAPEAGPSAADPILIGPIADIRDGEAVLDAHQLRSSPTGASTRSTRERSLPRASTTRIPTPASPRCGPRRPLRHPSARLPGDLRSGGTPARSGDRARRGRRARSRGAALRERPDRHRRRRGRRHPPAERTGTTSRHLARERAAQLSTTTARCAARIAVGARDGVRGAVSRAASLRRCAS